MITLTTVEACVLIFGCAAVGAIIGILIMCIFISGKVGDRDGQ